MICSYVSQREKRQMVSEESGGGIRLARIVLDLTQTQLAQKINSKQKSISRYETGALLPSIRTLIKIAKVLKKRAGYFLEKQDVEDVSPSSFFIPSKELS